MFMALLPAIGESIVSYGGKLIERIMAEIFAASTLWEWIATMIALLTMLFIPYYRDELIRVGPYRSNPC